MIDIQQTQQRLQDHLHALTVNIGERSVRVPENLEKTAAYITSFYQDIGVAVETDRPIHMQNCRLTISWPR